MDEQITEKQVWDVLQFANSLNSGQFGMGVYTPQMLNQALIDLNTNPQAATSEKITKALYNYKYSASDLQGMTEFMEYTDMLFKRTIMYYSNLLAFDLSISCKNAYVKSDYTSDAYVADKKIVYKFLDRFKYKAEFQKMVKEMLRRETVFTWFRDDDATSALQTMPQKYCKLTGYFPQGLLYNFDMSYFLQAGVDIDSYTPVFKDYYNNVFNEVDSTPYRQSKTLNNMDSTFTLWTETSPVEGAWVFKFDTSNFNSVPFLSALMQDAVFNNTIRGLQKDKNVISAAKIIIGEIPLLGDQKSQKADAFAVDPSTLGSLLAIIKSTMDKNFKITGAPMKEIEDYQYEDSNPQMYNIQNTSMASVGTSASRVIYSSDRASQSELEASLMNDYMTMSKLYVQFENFLNFYINSKTRKYKFSFRLDGSTLPFERKARIEKVTKLAEFGVAMKSAIASAYGYEPSEFDSMIMESKAEEFEFSSIHTKDSTDDKGGAPVKETVGDAGEKSRNAK